MRPTSIPSEIRETTVQAGLFAFLDLHAQQGAKEFLQRFHSPTFSVKEAGITAKRFHDWLHAGLLPFELPEGKKNLLTFPEYIWVRLIDKLRLMGYSLERIRMLKEYLFEKQDMGSLFALELNSLSEEQRQQLRQHIEGQPLAESLREQVLGELDSEQPFQQLTGTKLPLLEMLLLYQLQSQQELGVVLYPDGELQLGTETDDEARPSQTHLYLSITEEVREFKLNPHLEQKAQALALPSPQEWQVIQALRDRQTKEVTVTFVDKGSTRHMDLVTKRNQELDEETERQLVELLQMRGYTEVTLKTNRGELVHSESSKRKRLQ